MISAETHVQVTVIGANGRSELHKRSIIIKADFNHEFIGKPQIFKVAIKT